MVFQKATRKRAKMRLALTGPSGSGKTLSALYIARGIAGPKGKIAMIDTERGSGELYSDATDYDAVQINQPFSPDKYIAAIQEAEKLGYDVLIIDSLSHAWNAEGGILSLHDKATKSSRSGNSFNAWRDVTPLHNKLIDTILGSNIHIITTMRSKQEYVQEKDEKGKTNIRKVGMAPVQREGTEYEFTVVLDLNMDHYARASKDRTTMLDGASFIPTVETGECLIKWLNEAEESAPATPEVAAQEPAMPAQAEPKRDATGVPEPKRKEAVLVNEEQIAKYRELLNKLSEKRKWDKAGAVNFHKQVLASAKVDELKKLTLDKYNALIELLEGELNKQEQASDGIN